jgi:hypothetical protein
MLDTGLLDDNHPSIETLEKQSGIKVKPVSTE